MKRVLIITYYWPPSGGSGVQRWLKFAKYLPQFNWEPIIYTPLNPDVNSLDKSLSKDVSENLIILKKKIWEPYGFYKALLGKGNKHASGEEKANTNIKANIIADSSKTSLFHKISLFIRGNFFIPDPRCFWIKPSVKYLSKWLEENKVDAIVSTGPPHSMHLIAKRLSKKTNIPWIADFRDPWTEIFYFKHLKLTSFANKKHKRLEQSVLDNASKVIVVSKKMQKEFEKRTSTPIEVITNGFDPDDFSSKIDTLPKEGEIKFWQAPIDTDKDYFTLTHTGIFVDNGNPNYLWSVLKEKCAEDPLFKEQLRIRLIGQVDDTVLKCIIDANLEDNLINMGYMPHNKAILYQKSAWALLLPLRKEPEAGAILTGKFFEYLASGRKILAFGPIDGDLALALKETQSGNIVDFQDKEGIRKEIDVLYNTFLEQGKLDIWDIRTTDQLKDSILKYSRKNLTERLSQLLNNLN